MAERADFLSGCGMARRPSPVMAQRHSPSGPRRRRWFLLAAAVLVTLAPALSLVLTAGGVALTATPATAASPTVP